MAFLDNWANKRRMFCLALRLRELIRTCLISLMF
jgi:hypothetical protein